MFGTFKDSKRGINTKGIGLGLVICKLIVGNFNGQINFYSKYKKGTTFYFTFDVQPLSAEDKLTLVHYTKNEISTIRSIANIDQNSKMGEVSLLKKVEELMQFSNDRILLADDEPFCLESMKVLLEKAGFDVVNKVDVCISGEEMLSLVSSSFENGINYKLVFTDYSMPGMDGVEATR